MQSVMLLFSTQLCKLSFSLTLYLVQLSPPPPFPACIVLGLRHLRKVPLQVNRWRYFALPSLCLIFLQCSPMMHKECGLFSNKFNRHDKSAVLSISESCILVKNSCLGLLSFSGIYLVPGRSASQTSSSGTGIKRFIVFQYVHSKS